MSPMDCSLHSGIQLEEIERLQEAIDRFVEHLSPFSFITLCDATRIPCHQQRLETLNHLYDTTILFLAGAFRS